ncbi:MAG: hypothetical protein IJK38_11215 [Oscillospiraceae bacterium]|nr:hypothetical protein [Oscillospiraceae bacterium]
MSTNRLPFTPEQKAILAANPFTLCVNDYTIRFTKAFKEYILAEHERNKTPWKQVFRKAGYDPDLLGQKRMENIIFHARKEASSPGGLRETAPKKKNAKDLEKKRMQTQIRELQEEMEFLKQQIEFLKKTKQIREMENTCGKNSAN